MTVSILFITHSGLGLALMNTLVNTFGHEHMPMKSLCVGKEPDPENLAQTALAMVEELNQGDGVLVFTDMIGSTPCNVAQKLLQMNADVRIISGVNLPMIFRVFNYHNLPLDVLVQKALTAGKEGILEPGESRMSLVKTKKKTRETSPSKRQGPYDKKASSDH